MAELYDGPTSSDQIVIAYTPARVVEAAARYMEERRALLPKAAYTLYPRSRWMDWAMLVVGAAFACGAWFLALA